MITFYLVRHGNKEPVPFDPPLTKTGIKQAEATAKHLKDISFKAIIASPKLRTQQTAQIIAKEQALAVVADERLQERMEWEYDESFDQFMAEWTKTDIDRNYQPKNRRSSHSKGKQMREVIEELSNVHKDGNVLIVSHGGSIGDLLRNLFAEETLPHVTAPESGAKYIDILECSVTVIKKDGESHNLLRFNDTTHYSAEI